MIISLKKSIYPLRAIKKSIKAYRDLATFTVVEKNGYFNTKLTKIDQEVKDIIKDEFCNNVISQIRQ